MFFRLDPPIPVNVARNAQGFPASSGWAFGLLDYGLETNVLWGVAMDATGEVWWVPNPMIRFQENLSAGRIIDEK